jgi:hypothetical protein
MSLPETKCLQILAKLSIKEDKPILLDYYNPSINNSCFIGINDDNEKILVKNSEEYTSSISKLYNVEKDIVVVTENSIYVVSNNIPKKKIN